jgi:hypothetical protein
MAIPPELQQLLSESVNRTKYQNPLFQAVTQMAYGGLPTYAREGTSLGQLGPAAPIQPQPDGGMPDWLKMLAAGAGGAALGALGNGGGGPLKAALDGLKKLFGGNKVTTTVQGNKPYGGGTGLPIGNPYIPSFFGWDNGASANPSPSGLDPQVTTSETYSYPNDIFNDPYVLNSLFNGMPNDPSGGSGIGPGMQKFYGGASGDHGPDDDWDHP